MPSPVERRRLTRAEKEAARQRAVAGLRPVAVASTGGEPPRKRLSALHALAAAALLALFAAQAMWAAARDSVTIDEFIHVPIGLHALHTGDLRQDPINSHLPRMFAALPLLFDGTVFDPPTDAAGWGLGYYFQQANAADYQSVYVKARAMIVLLSLLAAAVMARWAFELYGPGAAVAALAMFALSPSLLAHGHLVTLDMAGTLGFLLCLYANWRLLERPTPGRAAWLGAALGVANLLKLSGVTLVAMMLATWVIRMASGKREFAPDSRVAASDSRLALALPRWILLLATVGAVTLAVVNAGYLFDGTFGLLREATLAPGGKLARLAEAMPWLRLPMPRPFINGIDMVLEVGKGREPSYFLAGELSADGWWYYHLAAFAAKCPLPLQAASLWSIGAWAAGRSKGRRDYAVIVPVLLLFAANSAFNSLYIGERHVLAAYPLLFIAISPWIASALASRPRRPDEADASRKADWQTRARAWVPAAAAAVVLLWTAVGTAAVGPRYLQYFNEQAGGPEGGHRVLIDSNIDWGQDLLRLRDWMTANGVDSVALAYFGRVDPGVYGIRFTPLERSTSHGKAVVSATFLMGRPYFWILGGRQRWVPAHTYSWLQGQKPIARVGSMFVFDLP